MTDYTIIVPLAEQAGGGEDHVIAAPAGSLAFTGLSPTATGTVAASTAWVGIPDPTSALGYDPIAVTEPADPGAWPGAQSTGNYYIDPSHGSSTDSNTYGWPDTPRNTIPTSMTLSGGSKCVVVGDGNTYTGGNITVSASGASSAAGDQAWFIGRSATDIEVKVNRPIISNRRLTASSQYVIISDVKVAEQNTDDAPLQINAPYCTLRNFELEGDGIESTRSNTAIHANSLICIYNGEIHDYGEWETNSNDDVHGIKLFGTHNNIWILELYGYHIQGDTVQVGDAQAGNPNNIYLGGVSGHENKENNIDTKDCTDVIISGGVGRDMDNNWGDDAGADVVIHDDSHWVWIIGRTAYRCGRGVVISGGSQNTAVINSLYRDMTAAGGTGLFDPGTGISVQAQHCAIVNNTFYNCRHGSEWVDGTDKDNSEHKNNIYHSRNESGHGAEHFDVGQDYKSSEGDAWGDLPSDYNMYDDALNGRSYDDGTFREPLSSWTSGTDANSTEDDPLFTNEGSDDYTLQAGSPAIAAGSPTKPAIYATFLSRYGIDIEKDLNGDDRPASGADWDLGCYQRP